MQQDTAVQGQMKTPRRLELLAPAKNIDVGQAAILAGADAVYIGGPSFGARAAAGNTMEEIASLCAFAHRFGARVYLTVNTLLYDEELDAVERMLAQAQDAGVDALIVQDPALLSMPSLQNMEIHASTQMNIDTLEKVDFCRSLHYSQIVLPREFSLEQIREFCQQRPDTRFEVFVSGAMCVSVSGICYISELMTGRSANRGACAQICRLPMTMYQRHRDSTELQEIAHGHLLSMKDNLRLAQLEDLVAAGASSFKIEGRLKDHDYVVNQVSAFRERLDRIIAQHPELYVRASLGSCVHGFTPDLYKTFNRGFTHAYLQDDNTALVDPRTPKNLGEELGVVRNISAEGGSLGKGEKKAKAFARGRGQGKASAASFSGAGAGGAGAGIRIELQLAVGCTLSNGDSFTFFDEQGELTGFRVNRISVKEVAKGARPQRARAQEVRGAQSPARAKGANDSSAGVSDSSVKVAKGSTVYLHVPKSVAGLHAGVTLYRNVDTLFIKSINMPQALTRQVPLQACITIAPERMTITFKDDYGRSGQASLDLPVMFEPKSDTPTGQSSEQQDAQSSPAVPSSALKPEVMVAKLQKLGSPFVSLPAENVELKGDLQAALLPLSSFNQLRRQAFADYEQTVAYTRKQALTSGVSYLDTAMPYANELLYTPLSASEWQQVKFPERSIDPRLICNQRSREFYLRFLGRGVQSTTTTNANDNTAETVTLASADEQTLPPPPALISKAVMTCRNCLIKNHATCHKDGGRTSGYFVRIGKYDFDIVTDCRKCLMYLVPAKR